MESSHQQAVAARDRVQAKIEYAELMLDELKAHPENGSPFDRAHEEAVLFHLHGAVDAFLQEINVAQHLGIPLEKVKCSSVKKALESRQEMPRAFERLVVEVLKATWFRQLVEFRNHGTHRASIPRTYYIGHPQKDGHIELRHPTQLIEGNRNEVFSGWIASMRSVLTDLSRTLWRESGLPT